MKLKKTPNNQPSKKPSSAVTNALQAAGVIWKKAFCFFLGKVCTCTPENAKSVNAQDFVLANSHGHKVNGHRPYWWPDVASLLIPAIPIYPQPHRICTKFRNWLTPFNRTMQKANIVLPHIHNLVPKSLSVMVQATSSHSRYLSHFPQTTRLCGNSLNFWHYLSYFPTLLMIIKIQCRLHCWGRKNKTLMVAAITTSSI